jgi:hypothetical protein
LSLVSFAVTKTNYTRHVLPLTLAWTDDAILREATPNERDAYKKEESARKNSKKEDKAEPRAEKGPNRSTAGLG